MALRIEALKILQTLKHIVAGGLDVAYFDVGSPDGAPVVLLHGFPYDVHAYEEVTTRLSAKGRRCIVPYLRGYGPTRFRSPDTMRSGQQAALGADLLALMDALEMPSAVLAGYDWGGRAACIVAALWPDRVRGLVTGGGYGIQDIARADLPVAPELEQLYWYQYYLHGERGRAGLQANRSALCRLLWRQWSPTWAFDDAMFARTAQAYDNPDFVDVVVHSYRHRFGLTAGDARYDDLERRLAKQPRIPVPTIVLQGLADGVDPPQAQVDEHHHFLGSVETRLLGNVGHNLPQEAPAEFAEAVLDLT